MLELFSGYHDNELMIITGYQRLRNFTLILVGMHPLTEWLGMENTSERKIKIRNL